MTKSREVKMWTKAEIRALMDMWETESARQIAETLGRTHTGITAMASYIRSYSPEAMVKKHRNGQTAMLVKEVLSEGGHKIIK